MSQSPLPASRKNIPAMLADTELLFKQAKLGSEAFRVASPFPHVLLPGMIKANCRVALCEGLREWERHRQTGFYPQDDLPSIVHLLLWELSSSTLIRHLASLTGTPPLLPDPFLVHAGPQQWKEESVAHVADKEYFPRHPQTDLQNMIRLEIFVADDPQTTFPLELTREGEAGTFYSISGGTALVTASDNYRMIIRSAAPERWCSLLSYYYINDRARARSGEVSDEESSRAY